MSPRALGRWGMVHYAPRVLGPTLRGLGAWTQSRGRREGTRLHGSSVGAKEEGTESVNVRRAPTL